MKPHRERKVWLVMSAAALLGVAPTAGPRAPHALRAPAARETLHQKLFKALDEGDAKGVKDVVAADAVLWVVDHRGQPVTLQGDDVAQRLLDLWSQGEREDAATEITPRGAIGDVTLLELERPGLDPELYRCTSVATRAPAKDAGAAEGGKAEERESGAAPRLQIVHLHIAPAERRDYR